MFGWRERHVRAKLLEFGTIHCGLSEGMEGDAQTKDGGHHVRSKETTRRKQHRIQVSVQIRNLSSAAIIPHPFEDPLISTHMILPRLDFSFMNCLATSLKQLQIALWSIDVENTPKMTRSVSSNFINSVNLVFKLSSFSSLMTIFLSKKTSILLPSLTSS